MGHLLAGIEAQGQQAGDDVERHGRSVHPDAAEGIEKATHGRSDDGRRLGCRCRCCHGPREQPWRYDIGQQGLGGRHFEGAGGTEQEGQPEDQLTADVVGGAAHGQGQCDQRLQALAQGGDTAPVIAVGDVAGMQHEQHPRGEFHQADQAQVQHIAGQLVEVPANGHGEHLKAAGGEHTGQPERQKGRCWRSRSGVGSDIGEPWPRYVEALQGITCL